MFFKPAHLFSPPPIILYKLPFVSDNLTASFLVEETILFGSYWRSSSWPALRYDTTLLKVLQCLAPCHAFLEGLGGRNRWRVRRRRLLLVCARKTFYPSCNPGNTMIGYQKAVFFVNNILSLVNIVCCHKKIWVQNVILFSQMLNVAMKVPQ